MSCVVDVLRPFQRLLSCLSSVPRCVSWRSKAAMLAAYRSIWTFDEFLPSVLRILESRFAVLFRTGAGADSNVTFRAAAVFVFAAASPRPRFAGVFDWVRFEPAFSFCGVCSCFRGVLVLRGVDFFVFLTAATGARCSAGIVGVAGALTWTGSLGSTGVVATDSSAGSTTGVASAGTAGHVDSDSVGGGTSGAPSRTGDSHFVSTWLTTSTGEATFSGEAGAGRVDSTLASVRCLD
mmetsp:Transcript_53696/g.165190  ORF Transcript_53696/g.165190 Transcript_53696/m.165190 type:complete len:236 (-) Transcript_53696:68-775(-)